MKCIHCNAEISADGKYCPRCGLPASSTGEQKTVVMGPSQPAPESQPGSSPTVVESGWRITIAQGEGSGQTLNIGKRLTLGRDPANDIVLESRKVSRKHAVIQERAGFFVITDQGSSNGTYVNGKLITQPTQLQSGDSITIGDNLFTVQDPFAAPQKAATPATVISPPSTPPPQPPAAAGAVPAVPYQPTSQRPAVLPWVLGIGGIIAIIAVAALFLGGSGAFPIGQADPTATNTLTITPSETPTSTPTPVPPTPTDTPTFTPEPSSTPTDTPITEPTQTALPSELPTELPTIMPTLPAETVVVTPDLQALMSEAKIIIYEDVSIAGSQARYAKQALDTMGLEYTDAKDGLGDFKAQLLSGIQWDLVIAAAEGRNPLQGEFFDYFNQQITRGSALILEIWNLDKIGGGKASTLLTRCGVKVQGNWQGRPDAPRSVLWIEPDHPVFHIPNEGVSLVNYTPFWPSSDMGDLLRKIPGSEATLLAGRFATVKDSDATLVTCLDGKVIIQTHSSHDHRPEDSIRLWQNFIHYTLSNRLLPTP